MSIYAKIFNRMPAKKIQKCIKRFLHHDQVSFIIGMQDVQHTKSTNHHLNKVKRGKPHI